MFSIWDSASAITNMSFETEAGFLELAKSDGLGPECFVVRVYDEEVKAAE